MNKDLFSFVSQTQLNILYYIILFQDYYYFYAFFIYFLYFHKSYYNKFIHFTSFNYAHSYVEQWLRQFQYSNRIHWKSIIFIDFNMRWKYFISTFNGIYYFYYLNSKIDIVFIIPSSYSIFHLIQILITYNLINSNKNFYINFYTCFSCI